MNPRHALSIALVLILAISINEVYGQALTANVSQRAYAPGDTLIVFGKTFPDDSIIAELFNPRGRLVERAQIDADAEGAFSRTLMTWGQPSDTFPFGVYTLVLTSSINQDWTSNQVFSFTDAQARPTSQERRLELSVSVPSIIGKEESAKIIVEVLVNGVLVRGDPQETLRGSRIFFPDGNVTTIDNFKAIDDGIYVSDFRSEIIGHHIIHIQAFHQGMLASNAEGIYVGEGTVLSLGRELTRVNENLENLRAETIETNRELTLSVERVSAASGQVTSLLLPVLGMVVIIIVLQGTLLSRRARNSHQQPA